MFIADTTDTFIYKSRKTHGVLYDYSLVEYTNKRNKVKIICSIHGIFEQSPSDHIIGAGCKACAVANSANRLRKTTKIFILEVSKIHNFKYDYYLTDYVNNKQKVKIICPTHGLFLQQPSKHYSKGCTLCNDELYKQKLHFDFLENAKRIHGSLYDYSLVVYKSNKERIKIICTTHGIFEQRPDNHIGSSAGCPSCNDSKGEKSISNLLIAKKISFTKQMKFAGCLNIKSLPFDFYLTDYNICIEYDGRQHFVPVSCFGGEESFKDTQLNDSIKNEYCKVHNIVLLRISYLDFKNIEEIISNSLNNMKETAKIL